MSQITSYTKDTKNNIEGSTPGQDGLMAFATDTGSLYISNDGAWRETPLFETQNKPYNIPASAETLSLTPVLHWDASDSSSILNASGNVANDGDTVSEWKPQIGITGLYQQYGAYQPTYKVSSTRNNKPGIVCNGTHGLTTIAREEQSYSDGLTVMIVATYPGLSANETNGQFHAGNADTFGSTGYHIAHSYIFSPSVAHGTTGQYPHMRQHQHTTTTHYHYNANDSDAVLSDTIGSNGSITTGGGDAANRALTRTQYFNQYMCNTTHIYSSREDKGRFGIQGANTYLTTGAIHTYKASNWSDIVNGGSRADGNHNIWTFAGHNHNNLRPLKGFALGKVNTSNVFMSIHTFHEVYVFPRVLSDTDMTKLGEHLANKWQTGTGPSTGQFII